MKVLPCREWDRQPRWRRALPVRYGKGTVQHSMAQHVPYYSLRKQHHADRHLLPPHLWQGLVT